MNLYLIFPRILENEYEKQESVEATVDYRCPDCSTCKKYKDSDKTREVSVKKMADDEFIANSIFVY